MSTSRKQLEDWIKTIEIPSGVKVIDVGGAQKPIKGRTKSWGEAVKYYIADLPNPHQLDGETNKEFYINADLNKPMDVKWPEEDNKPADIVFCLEVSEYLYDPLTAFKNLAKMLKQDGFLYMSFHFLYPVHEPYHEDYLRYTFHGVLKYLELAGLELADYRMKNAENYMPSELFAAEGMKMAKEINHDATGWLIKARKI